MTDKEIKRLSKTELLSIIRDQEQELQQMKERLAGLEQALEDKKTNLEECGSIAEAALKIQHVFEAAQAAADQYLEEIRAKKEEMDAQSGQILAQAKTKADEKLHFSMEMEEQSRLRADTYWKELSQKLEAFYRSHQGLKEMLEAGHVEIEMPNMGVKDRNDKSDQAASHPGRIKPVPGTAQS